jgi:hypothetical protein
MTLSSLSTLLAFSPHVTLFPPMVAHPKWLTGISLFLLFWDVLMMSVIGLTNGTSTSCWGWYYLFQFLWHPTFPPHGLGLELLFSHCLLLRAAHLNNHGPLEGSLPLACFRDQRSPVIIPCTYLGWLNWHSSSAQPSCQYVHNCIHMKWTAFLNYLGFCKLGFSMQCSVTKCLIAGIEEWFPK